MRNRVNIMNFVKWFGFNAADKDGRSISRDGGTTV